MHPSVYVALVFALCRLTYLDWRSLLVIDADGPGGTPPSSSPRGRTLAARRYVKQASALAREAGALVVASEGVQGGTEEDAAVVHRARALVSALRVQTQRCDGDANFGEAYLA